MTHKEAINKALETLHKIAMGANAKYRIQMGQLPSNIILQSNIRSKSMDLQEIEKLASNVWEEIILKIEPKLPNTTIFECSSKDFLK